MKSTATLLLLLQLCVVVYAQEIPDSTAIERSLEEITVEAAPVIRKNDRDVYTVSDAVKRRSANPLNLLSNIGIPSLSVNDVLRKITVNGQSVQIRINGRKADLDQLNSIPVSNIRRIEFIDNPGLKYDGATAVLNIAVINPEHGGSLSISEMQAFNHWWNNEQASLTFEHGKNQFSLIGNTVIRHKLPIYRDYNDRYIMPDGSVIERTETPEDGHFTNHGIYTGLNYNFFIPEKTNIYISTWFPMNFGQELLYVGNLSTKNTPGSIHLTDKQLIPNKIQYISAYIEQYLPHDQILMANFGLERESSKSQRLYIETPAAKTSSDEEIYIDNNIKNRNILWSAETDYTKSWGKNKFTAGLRYSGSSIHARYILSEIPDAEVRQTSDRLYFFGEYNTQAGKWNITAGAAGTWQDNATQDMHISKTFFTPRISATWRYCDVSRWTLTLSSYTSAPSLSQTSDIMQQIDGFQIQQGNPNLHSYATYNGSLRYGFAVGKRLSGNVTVAASHSNRPIQDYYTLVDNKILHTWTNDGKAMNFRISFSPRLEYIPEWATISGSISFRRFHNEGRGYCHNLSNWYGQVDASFYHWGFDATISYERDGAILSGEQITRGESYTMFTLGYTHRGWHFSFGLFNPFGRYSQESTVISSLVWKKNIMRTTACDLMPFLSVSYNISWGRQPRQVSRKLESDLSGSGASAAGK